MKLFLEFWEWNEFGNTAIFIIIWQGNEFGNFGNVPQVATIFIITDRAVVGSRFVYCHKF